MLPISAGVLGRSDTDGSFASSAVPGIGHKIKSVNNPDLRVELVKAFAKKEFPSTDCLDYAIATEKVTSAKKDVSCF